MASFLKRLDELLRDATARGVLHEGGAQGLAALARERERGRGAFGLAGALGFLGGGSVILGIILVVSANWSSIPDLVKLGGLLVLLGGAHGLAFYLRAQPEPPRKTIESLHFVGGGLFLAGIGLVAQIYNLDARPPNGLLLWLLSLLPLAITLGSAPLGLLTIFALFLWAHTEGLFHGSPLEMPGFTSHLVLEIGLATALLSFAALVRRADESLSHVMRACGVLVLFAALYALGFFRFFVDHPYAGEGQDTLRFARMPAIALGLGAIGLVLGARDLAREAPAFRARLIVLLAALVLVAGAAVAAELERLPPGPDLSFFDFGSTQTFTLRDFLITAVAWLIWFALGLWCVAFGAHTGRLAYLNVGVLGIGIGIVTRSIDLFGGLAQTGGVILLGGTVLLVTAYALERWRRRMIRRLATAPAAEGGA